MYCWESSLTRNHPRINGTFTCNCHLGFINLSLSLTDIQGRTSVIIVLATTRKRLLSVEDQIVAANILSDLLLCCSLYAHADVSLAMVLIWVSLGVPLEGCSYRSSLPLALTHTVGNVRTEHAAQGSAECCIEVKGQTGCTIILFFYFFSRT